MKSHFLFSIALLMVFTSLLLAQQPAPEQQPQPTANAKTLPPGARLRVVLKKTLEARKAKVGDPVEFEIADAIKGKDDKVIVPDTAKLYGHVTEAQGSTKDQPGSRLGILIERMEWKGGSARMHAGFALPRKEDARGGHSYSVVVEYAVVAVSPNGSITDPAAISGTTGYGSPSVFAETTVEKSSTDPGSVLIPKTRNIGLPPGTRLLIEQLPAVQTTAAPTTEVVPQSK